jgi:D-alanyl-D-alanine carboxypeptidase (penicillin-binding protein 5/6)
VYRSVLTPVRRRRRRRWPRVLAGCIVAAGFGAAAFLLVTHELGGHTAPAAASPRRQGPPAPTTTLPALPPAPPKLLTIQAPPRHGALRATAPSAILVDETTGAVLWEKRPHSRRPIASTTKIMTATLVLERLPLDQVVQVPAAAVRTPLVREGLRRGERVPAWKLLDGLLIFSGNDDAYALSAATAGTRRRFVVLMNAKAHELGLRDTHFSSVSGVIDKNNYSSAWDLAALTRYALRDDRFRKVVRTRIARVRWAAPTYGKVYVNKNLLLGTYPGADGVKTGWTTLAGHCLVASAHRGDRRLIAVVLHSADPYRDARRLLNFGFARRPRGQG